MDSGIDCDDEYTVVDSKYRSYTPKLYVANGKAYIIGDFGIRPAPLYEVNLQRPSGRSPEKTASYYPPYCQAPFEFSVILL